jgi:hypothetical protein
MENVSNIEGDSQSVFNNGDVDELTDQQLKLQKCPDEMS